MSNEDTAGVRVWSSPNDGTWINIESNKDDGIGTVEGAVKMLNALEAEVKALRRERDALTKQETPRLWKCLDCKAEWSIERRFEFSYCPECKGGNCIPVPLVEWDYKKRAEDAKRELAVLRPYKALADEVLSGDRTYEGTEDGKDYCVFCMGPAEMVLDARGFVDHQVVHHDENCVKARYDALAATAAEPAGEEGQRDN